MKHILSLIIILITVAAYSQKIEDMSLKHSMKQDGLSLQFTVLDPDQKGVRRYDTHKTYFWYKSQHVLGTQGGSSGQLLHGSFESFYTGKQLCAKGRYNKGLKDGNWNYWRADGTLLRTEHWQNGSQHGEQIDYSDKGLVRKRTVIRGRRVTTDCGDTLVEITRHTRTVTLMDSVGRVREVQRYRNNLLHGKQEVVALDGSKTTTIYRSGTAKPAGRRGLRSTKPVADETTAAPTGKSFKDRVKNLFSKKEKTERKEPKKKLFKKRTTDAGDVQTEPAAGPSEPKEKKKFNLFKRKAA